MSDDREIDADRRFLARALINRIPPHDAFFHFFAEEIDLVSHKTPAIYNFGVVSEAVADDRLVQVETEWMNAQNAARGLDFLLEQGAPLHALHAIDDPAVNPIFVVTPPWSDLAGPIDADRTDLWQALLKALTYTTRAAIKTVVVLPGPPVMDGSEFSEGYCFERLPLMREYLIGMNFRETLALHDARFLSAENELRGSSKDMHVRFSAFVDGLNFHEKRLLLATLTGRLSI